jgi:hypothetical protein
VTPLLGQRTLPYEQPPTTYTSVRRAPLQGHVVQWPEGHGKVGAARTYDDHRVLEVWSHQLHDWVELIDGPAITIATGPLCGHCPKEAPC